jgi:arsenite-transporting ATPase
MIVTLPEATPVQEACDLQKDLERAGISPYAWIINQSLTPLSISNPVIAARRRNEATFIQKAFSMTSKTVIVPWQVIK